MKAYLDGKEIEFTHLTEFMVQVGYGSKGSYKTVNTLHGSLQQAVFYYNGINIGNGYKKRLVMWLPEVPDPENPDYVLPRQSKVLIKSKS